MFFHLFTISAFINRARWSTFTYFVNQKVFNWSLVMISNSVSLWSYSTLNPSAIYVSTSFPSLFSNTAFSVMTFHALFFAVKGSEHLSTSLNLYFPDDFELCCITMITLDPLFTKSIAPPIPWTFLPGTSQLAISHVLLTCNAPSMVMSRWPPRIIANDYELEKHEPPGKISSGCFPALIKSGSSSPLLA